MHEVTSFEGSAIDPTELSGIMAEYLELERLRLVRRMLVGRCGALALAASMIGFGLHWLTPFASWFSVSVFLGLPAAVWVFEIRRESRLGDRLSAVPGGITQVL
jgi:hypothetical protein